MRKRIALIVVALTLLTAVSREDSAPLVDLIGFALAIALYLVAVLLLFTVAISPLAIPAAIWLYIRHRRGYPMTPSLRRLHQQIRTAGPLRRVAASLRAARIAWREHSDSEPPRDTDAPQQPAATDAVHAANP